ncbi:hypothetical protein D3C71_2027780 [compost metagenome]
MAIIGHVDRDQQVLVVHFASPWQGMDSSMAQLAARLLVHDAAVAGESHDIGQLLARLARAVASRCSIDKPMEFPEGVAIGSNTRMNRFGSCRVPARSLS